MCLIVKKRWHKDGKPLIAEENIPVFKVLRKDTRRGLETPFFEYPIVFKDGKAILESELVGFEPRRYNDSYTCYKGIHACLDRLSSIALKRRCPGGNGLVYKAIIPKGTQYLIGINGDIVSTKMIIFNKTYNVL